MAVLLTLAAAGAMAQSIKTDASWGRTAQTLAGPAYAIPESLGKVAGNNLFQSFQVFNIDKGESATFTTSTPTLQNVISRVSGGSASTINGPLKLAPASGSAPAFFFINPAGVTFGAGASVDVPGAFHVSTASNLKLADGTIYSAGTGADSSFAVAAPQAFGFLGATRAAITIRDLATLTTKPSQPISIVGGDVELNRGSVLTANGGDIRVMAVGQKIQEVSLTAALPSADGNLTIKNGGAISSSTSSATDAGSVRVGAGNIAVDGVCCYSSISSKAIAGTGNAGSVDVAAAGNLSVVNGASIYSTTASSGSAGAVKVSAGSVTLDGQGYSGEIYSETNSTGNAGSVEVSSTGNLSIINGGRISSGTWSSGNAGSVIVNAGSITVDGKGTATGISNDANILSDGNAGSIEVTATGNLSLVSGGAISSGAGFLSAGNAGSVTVRAGGIAIDGKGAAAGIFSDAETYSAGNAGSISVTATGYLSIVNGGLISSNTLSSGNAGLVRVSASDIAIDGGGSSYMTGVSSDAGSGSKGNAGSINVSAAENLSVVNGGFIYSSTSGAGDAGSVKVAAGGVAIDGQGSTAGIIAQAGAGSLGKTGNVEVSVAGNLSIIDGGRISSNTFSSGNAGSVRIGAAAITIDSRGSSYITDIGSNANSGTGNSGNVDVIAAEILAIINGGRISSSTYSSGDAGSVKVGARSIVIDGQGEATGIYSQAISGSTGNSGGTNVSATENLSIINGGSISSSTWSSGNAGPVRISADSINIDGRGGSASTGIYSSSNAASGASGDAGSIDITATGKLSIINGGEISSSTWTSGKAGSVKIGADSVTIDRQGGNRSTGIYSNSNAASGASGDAGSIDIAAARELAIVNGGEISSSTWTSGNAGSVKTGADSITIDRQGSSTQTGIYSNAASGSTGNAGSIDITATGKLSIVSGGDVSSDTRSSGNAGSVKINAGSIDIDGHGSSASTGIYSNSAPASTGHAGNVSVSATGDLAIVDGGVISSTTLSSGDAGSVKVDARNIVIDGQGNDRGAGIVSVAAFRSTGNAGSVEVLAAQNLSIINGGLVSSDTDSSGNAGSVKVGASSMLIDGSNNHGTFIGTSSYSQEHGGNAGKLTVTADTISLTKLGSIVSETQSSGLGGTIDLQVKHLALNEGGTVSTTTWGTGNAGDIIIHGADDITIGGVSGIRFQLGNGRWMTGQYSGIYLNTQGSGNGGALQLDTRRLTISDGGIIGAAGIDNRLTNLPTTKAGDLNIAAGSIVLSGGGRISASTSSAGKAGSITVNADTSIAIGGKFDRNQHPDITNPTVSESSGIFSNATYTIAADENARTLGKTLGDGGNVTVRTPTLMLNDGGVISTDTEGAGRAGAVQISAGTLLVNGGLSSINASAKSGSSGQTGSLIVNVTDGITLASGGELSIRNDATVADPARLAPTLLSVSARDISVRDAQISSASTGNVAASNVQVNFKNSLSLDPSSITTSANAGNGGAIGIQGGKLIILDNSQITTSVLGASGNGGDINLNAQVLVMNSGFVQANTAAQAASGGNVSINVGALIPSGDMLVLGSRSAHAFSPGIFGSNVIEAASPSGLSGDIRVTSPALDLAGALGGLTTAMIDFGALGKDPCRVGAGSTLTPLGHGGLPPTASGAIRPENRMNTRAFSTGNANTPTIHLARLPNAPMGRGCH